MESTHMGKGMWNSVACIYCEVFVEECNRVM